MSRPGGALMPTLDRPMSQTYIQPGGFLRAYQMPVYGATELFGNPSSPLNTAASKLYYYVVHGNSRNISYDKSDLMKCYMAYCGVYSFLTEAIRAYSFIKAQSVENQWIKRIVGGLGWDYDDLTTNIVAFRKAINLAIVKLNQISIPDVFDIFKCHTELFTKVYCDRPSAKPQFMANVSLGVWVFEDVISSLCYATTINTSSGRTVNWDCREKLHTVADFTDVVNTLINNIYDSTDIGVIQGDLKRAFDQNQMISMDTITEDVEPALVYDAEYNLCIHNAEILRGVSKTPIATTTLHTSTSEALAVVRDRDSVDGNLLFLIATPSMNYEEDFTAMGSTHVMDLTDEWKEDLDAVLLMQKYKFSSKGMFSQGCDMILPSLPEYYEDIHQVHGVSPKSVGPAITLGFSYIWEQGADLVGQIGHYDFMNPVLWADSDSTVLEWVTKMFELGVTLLIYPQYHVDSTRYLCNPMWETQNVTVYDEGVLWNIHNAMIESLWYNSALYNI